MWWCKLGEVESECTWHNFSLFAIFLPKIIKIGGDLMKFWQSQFCTDFFETRCIVLCDILHCLVMNYVYGGWLWFVMMQSRAVPQSWLSTVDHAHITVTHVTVLWPWPTFPDQLWATLSRLQSQPLSLSMETARSAFLSPHADRHTGDILFTVSLFLSLSVKFFVTDISGVVWRRVMKFGSTNLEAW